MFADDLNPATALAATPSPRCHAVGLVEITEKRKLPQNLRCLRTSTTVLSQTEPPIAQAITQ